MLGGARARYGSQRMGRLGQQLAQEFGRGFEAKNLFRMVQFAQAFPDAEIVATLPRQLSWSHLVVLLPLKAAAARSARCMGIEGGTHLPAFLLHDSPREADLGQSLYHRLFRMVAMLEGPEHPVFQYIVTTTTQPPPELQKAPWLGLELHGAPATEWLLRCDLP